MSGQRPTSTLITVPTLPTPSLHPSSTFGNFAVSSFLKSVTTTESNDIWHNLIDDNNDYYNNASVYVESPENFLLAAGYDLDNDSLGSWNVTGAVNGTFDERVATIQLISMIVTAILLGFIILATVIGE
ncbi:hypothetical protein JTB14_002031 [Gonioctena quinquepunctata]|nr:hypothetical protein JTB14_002031 [Gonioctena quinquepunctata]